MFNGFMRIKVCFLFAVSQKNSFEKHDSKVDTSAAWHMWNADKVDRMLL